MNNFAISSQGIGEALIRSAAALSQANNDLDKSIALVTAANNVVQDPQVVGTALRTVSMRIRGAKAELEEMGESTEGLADSVSSLRDEILALSGVDIMIDDNTFKDTYDIMLDLANVWDKLSDVSQAALLEKIAGKRGANAVASILSNVEDLEAAYATARNSAGSAAAENLKYLESIEGKLKQLQASWQEFWDSSILSSAIKSGADGLNVLLQALNKLGGMDFAVTLAGIAGLYAGIKRLGKVSSVFHSIQDSVKNLSAAMNNFNGRKLSIWDLIVGKDFLNEKALKKNIDSVVSSVTSAYSTNFLAGGSNSAAATSGMNAALKELSSSQIAVSESSKRMLQSFVETASQQTKNISLDEQQALKTKILANEMKNGADKSVLLANAQKVLVGAMKAGAMVLLTLAIQAVQKYIRDQEELRQSILDNATAQVDNARSLRKATKEFDKVNEDFKKGYTSQDQFREAIEKVNKALGDQVGIMEGYTPGSAEWRKRIEALTQDQSKAAKRAADAAAAAAVEQTFKEKVLDTLLGWTPIAKNRGDANKFTRGGQIKLIKEWQDELDNVEKEYDEILRRQEEALNSGDKKALNGIFGFGGINKEIRENRAQYEKLNDDIRKYSETVDTAIKKIADSLAEGRLRNSKDVAEFYQNFRKEAEAAAELHGLPIEETVALLEDRMKEISGYSGYFTEIEDAETALKKLGMTASSVLELLQNVSKEDLAALASPDFISYVDEERLWIRTTEQAIETLNNWRDKTKEAAYKTNTLTGVVNANKDAIDNFQSSVQKLASILKADYSNNASGMIDDLQELIEILGTMDAKDAEKFFDKLNNSFNVSALGDAMKDVSEEAMKVQFDKLVEQLNLANPALEEALWLFIQQEKELEALTADLSTFKSAYQSLTSIIKDYNENGFLTADNIASILEMSPEYLSALDYEGGKLRINEEALKRIVIARLEEAKQQIETNRQTRLSAIYAEQEARTKQQSTIMTYEHAKALYEEAVAANKSQTEILKLEKRYMELAAAQQGVKNIEFSGTLDPDLQEQADAVNENADSAIDSINHVQSELKSGSRDALNTFLGVTDDIEKDAKDAANELKSQIDSVLSKWKSALDSGAINYKQYLDKMKAMRDKYADQLSQEDLLQMDVDIAQTEVDMWKEAGDALGRQIDRTMIKPLQDRIEGLNKEREALQKNKEATSAYYDEIIGGLEDQKQAIDDNIKAVEKSYEAQIKPLEAQQKAINKQIKAIEKEKRVIEDQIKLLERSKRPYEHQQKAIQKEIRAIEKEIKVLEKSKKPYEQKQKAIEKEIKAMEREVRALERTKKPYEQQQKAIEKEIKAVEKQIKALEKTKKPYEDQKKAIDKQVKAIQNQIKAIEDSKRPYEDQQKAINKQIKAIQKQVKELEKSKKPYEQQQRAIDKQSKAIQKQIRALEKTKKPYEEQQKAIDKEIKAIQKQIKAIQDTEKPYKEEQKYLQQSIRAIEEKIKAFEKLQKPYKDQLTLINNEIAALEREIELMNRTKRPLEERQQAIQNEIDALEYQAEVIERQENVYKREQDAINKDIELIERQVAALEHRKKPYEIAQRQISRQIDLLQQEQKELEKLKKPYEDEIKLLEEELEAMQKANEERQAALDLQQAEYNLRRAQQQRVNYVYQDGQFQYVADQGAIKDAQKAIDDLKYQESVKRVQDAIDALQDKIDEITAQSELIQDDIDALTEKNDQLSESIQRIQDEIDPLQDEIDELSYHAEELQWSINDIEYSMTSLRYAIEDLEITNADLSESIRQIDEAIQPLENRLNSLKDTAADLQWEIDLIQQNIDPLNDQISGLNDRIQELQLVIDSIEESIEPLNEQIEELTERNELLQESIDEITESIEPLQEQIDELSEQSEEVQEIIDGITEAIEPLNDEIDALTDRNDEIQEIIDEIGESIDGLNRQIDDLNAQGDAIQEMIDQIDEAIYPLEEHIDSLNEKNEELQEHIDAIDEAIAPLQDRIDELGYQSEELQDAIDAIDEAIEPLQEHIEELNEQNEELQEHIDAINDEIEELNYQLEPLNDQIEELNRQNEDLSEAIEILREQQELEVEALQQQSDAIQEQIDYYQQLKTQAEEAIQAQIDKLDEHIDALEQEVQGIEEYKNKLTEIFDEIDARKDEDLLTTLFGEGWQEKLKSLDPSIIEAFATGYEGATDRLRLANEAVINSLDGEEGIEGAANRADAEVTELKEHMEQGEAAMGSGSLKEAIDQTGSSALIMAGNFDTAKDSWDRFYEAVRVDSIDIQGFLDVHVFQWVAKIREEMDKLPAAMDFFKRSVVDENGPQIVLQFQAINEEIQKVKKSIEEDIPNALRSLKDYIEKDFAEGVKNTSEDIKRKVIEDVDAIVDHVKTQTVPELQQASEDVKNKIEEDVDYLVDVKFPYAHEETVRIAQETRSEIETEVDGLVQYIENAVDDVLDYIEGHNGKERLLRIVQDTIDEINDKIDTFVNEDLPRHLAEIENQVRDSVNTIVDSLNPISEKVDEIKGHVQVAAAAMQDFARATNDAQGPAAGLREIFWNIEGSIGESARRLNEELIPALEKAAELGAVAAVVPTLDNNGNNNNNNNNDNNNNGGGGGDGGDPPNGGGGSNNKPPDNPPPGGGSGQLYSSKGDDSKTTPYVGTKTINIYMYGEAAAYERAEKYRARGFDVHMTRGKEYIETLSRYALGGVVTNKGHSNLDSIARSVGEDRVIAVRDGERILTPQQNKNFEKLVDLAPNLVKSIETTAQNVATNVNVGADTSDAISNLNALESKVRELRDSVTTEFDSAGEYARNKSLETTEAINEDVNSIVGEEGTIPLALDASKLKTEETLNEIAGEEGLLDQTVGWINDDINSLVGEEGTIPIGLDTAKTSVESTLNEIAGEEGLMDQMTQAIADDMNNIVGEEGIVPSGLNAATTMTEAATNYIAGEGGLMDQMVGNINQDIDQVVGKTAEGAGLAGEITDSLANHVFDRSNAVKDQIVSDVTDAVSATQDGGNYISQIAEAVANNIVSVLEPIRDLVDSIKGHIQESVVAMDNLGQSSWNAKEALSNVNGALDEVIPKFERAVELSRELGNSDEVHDDGRSDKSNSGNTGSVKSSSSRSSSSNRNSGKSDLQRDTAGMSSAAKATYIKKFGGTLYNSDGSKKSSNKSSSGSSFKSSSSNSSGSNKSNAQRLKEDLISITGKMSATGISITDSKAKPGYAAEGQYLSGKDTVIGFNSNNVYKENTTRYGAMRTLMSADKAATRYYGDGWTKSDTRKSLLETLNNISNESDNAFKVKKGAAKVKGFFGFAKGGIVPKKEVQESLSALARSIGEDAMVAVKEGERILTPKQNKDFEEFVKLTPELINATESLAKYAKLFADISTLDSMASENGVVRGVNGVVDRANGAAVTANSVSLTIGDIHVHEVENTDDLARQIKNNLPNSLLQALGKAS